MRYESADRIARGVDLETHLPSQTIACFRAFSVNIRPPGHDSDLTGQGLSHVVGLRPCLNLRAHEDFVSVPAFHRHAAVLPAVNGDHPPCRGDRLLLNHAMRTAVAAPVVVARKLTLFFTAILASATLSERRAASQT